jgi:hypothetical protein
VSDPDRFSYGIVPAPSVEHQAATWAQKFHSCPIQRHPTVSKRCSHFVGRQQHDVASGLRVHRAGRPRHGTAVLREVLFEALQRRLCGSAQPCETLGQAGRIGRSSTKIAQAPRAIGSSARQTYPSRRAALTSCVETHPQTSLPRVGASAAAVGCSNREQQQAPSPYQASLAAALHCLSKRETTCSATGAQLSVLSCKNSGDGGLRGQPCRPRAAHPVKWGSLHIPLPGTSSAKFYTGSIWLAFSVVATHNLSLLSVPSFSAKRSKLHYDGIQFLFSSSEEFALASPWTGSSERVMMSHCGYRGTCWCFVRCTTRRRSEWLRKSVSRLDRCLEHDDGIRGA